MSEIAKRFDEVKSVIFATAAAAGRQPSDVELIAVTKTHPVESVQEALDAGQCLFGENRVQEARAKIPLLPAKARWHLIGHLQKNKVRHALPLFELIHGVDSVDLARDIDRIAVELGLFPRILLEVNVSEEATKFGFKPEVLQREIETLLGLKRLQIEGLMTIAPVVEKPDEARPYFAQLRNLRDTLEQSFGVRLPSLSMGMSGDYTAAIAEGATMVRIGTALFGQRPRRTPPDA